MSSMRNAASQRTHKERAQPKERQKWGLLEKHRDYALRARDYNTKKAKLAALTEKARNKNKDEFAFGMLSANKPRAGKHGQRGDPATARLSHRTIKLLKTQDAGYLRVVAGKARKEIQKAEEGLLVAEGGEVMRKESGVGKKMVFLDGAEEEAAVRGGGSYQQEGYPISQPLNIIHSMIAATDPIHESTTQPKTQPPPQFQALNSRRPHPPTTKSTRDLRIAQIERKRLAAKRARRLEALRAQQKQILAVADELDLQRARMANQIGGVSKDGVKWKMKKERKR